MHLDPPSRPPGPNAIEPPFAVPPKGALWGEDEALRPSQIHDAFKELLPRRVAHRFVEWEIAPVLNARTSESHLKLNRVEKSERCRTAQEKIWMRIKA
jgi:hypothetical protein